MEMFFTAFVNGIGLLADPVLLAIIFAGTMWGVIGGGHPGGSQVLTISVVIPLTVVTLIVVMLRKPVARQAPP